MTSDGGSNQQWRRSELRESRLTRWNKRPDAGNSFGRSTQSTRWYVSCTNHAALPSRYV